MRTFSIMSGAAALGFVLCATAVQAGDARPHVAPGAGEAAMAPAPVSVPELLGIVDTRAMMQIVATEGARHGLTLEAQLFPGKGGDAWAREVARIQDHDRLLDIVGDVLGDELRVGDAGAAAAFFASDLGQRIVSREVAARRAMLDAAVEAEAKQAGAMLREAETPRAALIGELIGALDLVSTNVSGGMNANFAFYRGLGDGGALRERLTEADMLAMVREQADSIRASTEAWLRAYLAMAYAPLTDRELAEYVAFARTDAGRRYSAAMFASYGRVFEATSYELGRAAARFMEATDT
jgi:hypothetical protein